jgi:hypothetical protein
VVITTRGGAGGRAPGPHHGQVGGVVEDQQRRPGGGGQPGLGPRRGRGGIIVGTALAEPLGQASEAGQDLAGGLGGDPGHDRPAGGLAGPGVGGGQQGLAHSWGAADRADHHRTAARAFLPVLVRLAEQGGQLLPLVSAGLEAGRALRDVALDDLARLRRGRRGVVDLDADGLGDAVVVEVDVVARTAAAFSGAHRCLRPVGRGRGGSPACR